MPSPSLNPAMRAHLETQIAVLADLTRKSCDTTLRLNELHLTLTRDLCDDFFSLSQQLVSSTDPMQLAALLTRQIQPMGARMRNYLQQFGAVLSGAQRELTRAAETLGPEAARAAHAAQDFAASAMRLNPRDIFPSRPGGNGAA